jgi:stringent starvation protein B
MSSTLASQRPYLLRAMYEWMTDCGQTPHLVVNATVDGVDVPRQHIKDDKIILNVSSQAVKNLSLGNDLICFEARFAGAPFQISLPVSAIQGIYARETSKGMVFQDDVAEDSSGGDDPGNGDGNGNGGKPRGPHLKVVK